MKVCIGYTVVEGPWGGGNGFYAGLIRYLRDQGVTVTQSLDDDDIDIIILTDPRRRNPNIPFSHNAAWRYVRRRNPDCLVVHRINECDERKNTTDMNRRLKDCNETADYTVFVGGWLRELDLWLGPDMMPNSVIHNGSDPQIYNRDGFRPWDRQGPLRLVTHHWGGNWMKGFDIYQRLDQMMADPTWKDRIAFTYIGNLPKGFRFEHATHVAPKSGKDLADAIRQHQAYVTGSINEPGGNHQNEGAQCGLPILYRNSGCLPEYLDGYGIRFDGVDDFDAALERLLADYPKWAERVQAYPNNLDVTCARWHDLLCQLVADKDSYIARRANRPDGWARWRRYLLP